MQRVVGKRPRQFEGSGAVPKSAGIKRSNGSGDNVSGTGPGSPRHNYTETEDVVWQRKTKEVRERFVHLAQLYATKERESKEVQDALEQMVTSHEMELAAVEVGFEDRRKQHLDDLRSLRSREEACFSEKRRVLEETAVLQQQRAELQQQHDRLREEIVVHSDALEQLRKEIKLQSDELVKEERRLGELIERHRLMQDASCGSSGEVRDILKEMEWIRSERDMVERAGRQTEILRRQLYSQFEEMKGTIRVYCRVKGSSVPAPVTVGAVRGASDSSAGACGDEGRCSSDSQREDSVSSRGTMQTPCSTGNVPTSNTKEVPTGRFVFPDTGDEEKRSLSVMFSRNNATSTGKHETREMFTFDRVFDGTATQGAVYAAVEPLVNCAVDGYRVCVFAYGQTGSGKTYSMLGDPHDEQRCGITPRALRTVFKRQGELKADGWKYMLSCYFVEIYNDVIRDLQQDVSLYEPGGAAASQPNYHVIKQNTETGSTSISGVLEKRINTLEDFQRLYDMAMKNRSTAKTALNDRSSRSHCIFVLRIAGENAGLRQRSEGILCMVDLAGSERVHESGVQGKHFKEAVNINRSLLDLGKCISALNKSGSVAPWRNCKLTYLLQNYLGAKGGKMLMLVTVSDQDEHLSESINSLRFAKRVNQTVVGPSIKRVGNF